MHIALARLGVQRGSRGDIEFLREFNELRTRAATHDAPPINGNNYWQIGKAHV